MGVLILTALLALGAVWLVGSSLIDLSERRFRFVSAVTHELRTPLTSLRLYLDLLTSGLVREEEKKSEYLHTLNGEADRLHRLVGNVLDFARLERGRPKLTVVAMPVTALLDRLEADWQVRCAPAGKLLITETKLRSDITLLTDGELLQQILGNLLDNACKYSKEAADPRVWLRALAEGNRLVFEVEDRGPGRDDL